MWKTLFASNPLRSDLSLRDERQPRQKCVYLPLAQASLSNGNAAEASLDNIEFEHIVRSL